MFFFETISGTSNLAKSDLEKFLSILYLKHGEIHFEITQGSPYEKSECYEYSPAKYGIEKEIWAFVSEYDCEMNIPVPTTETDAMDGYFGKVILSPKSASHDMSRVMYKVTSYLLTEVERRIRTPKSPLSLLLNKAHSDGGCLFVSFVIYVDENPFPFEGIEQRIDTKSLFTALFLDEEMNELVQNVKEPDGFNPGHRGDPINKALESLRQRALMSSEWFAIIGSLNAGSNTITKVDSVAVIFSWDIPPIEN